MTESGYIMKELSNKKCFFGLIYGRTIAANSLTQLKRLASRIANGYFNATDEMRVTVCEYGQNTVFYLYRSNKKAPNNTIVYGQWK